MADFENKNMNRLNIMMPQKYLRLLIERSKEYQTTKSSLARLLILKGLNVLHEPTTEYLTFAKYTKNTISDLKHHLYSELTYADVDVKVKAKLDKIFKEYGVD